MVTPTSGVDHAMDLSSGGERRGSIVQDAPIFLVRNFGNGNLLAFGGQRTEIVYLPAARRIERSAVEHDGSPAVAIECFDHASVEVVEERVVIVEAVGGHGLSKPGIAANARE